MFNSAKFVGISDEDIIELIKNKDNEALEYLIAKYHDLVVGKVSKYFIIGAEEEDIIQEGLIGLYKAIMNYKKDSASSFKSFANLCIERQLITAIKTSNRQKHMPLNSYVSLNMPAYDEDNDSNNSSYELGEMLNTDTSEDPLEMITKQEYIKNVEEVIDKTLSSFEKQVLNRYVQGESYTEIANGLNTQVKSIDNAIQRIRKKTNKNIDKNS